MFRPTRGNLHTGIQYVICFWGSPEKRGKGPHFNGYLEDPGGEGGSFGSLVSPGAN